MATGRHLLLKSEEGEFTSDLSKWSQELRLDDGAGVRQTRV